MTDYPTWICPDCGSKHGMYRAGQSTWHKGDACGWCGSTDKAVTNPRDYGYPPAPEMKK